MLVDMASQASVRQFAAKFKLRYPRLDVLIHKAANFDHTFKQPIFNRRRRGDHLCHEPSHANK
jgi:NAD(P)-dependent dehydrogenase (short-subunit alcohol dehydrogenase family)